MTSFNPNYFPKTSSPNTIITLRVRVLTYKFRGQGDTDIQSITVMYAIYLCTCTCMSVHVHECGVFACLCMHFMYVRVSVKVPIGIQGCGCIYMCKYVHVSTFCVYAYVHLSVYTQIRGWGTSSQVNPSASWSKSPVKVRVTQRGLRWDFGELGPKSYCSLDQGGGDSPAAHACHPGLQQTLIIDQQIPNVNRAIRPENTDIHHPDTNYAAGPYVITGVQLNA